MNGSLRQEKMIVWAECALCDTHKNELNAIDAKE